MKIRSNIKGLLMSCGIVAATTQLSLVAMANPTITSVTHPTTVQRYEKFEVDFDVSGSFTNPYDYGDIEVTAEFVNTTLGVTETIDGFFYQDFTISAGPPPYYPDIFTELGNGYFKLRYTPRSTGNYEFRISATDQNGLTVTGWYSFTVSAQAPGNNGFISLDASNDYMTFDNNEIHVPINANMACSYYKAGIHDKTLSEYELWFDNFSANGGNTARIWMDTYWGFSLDADNVAGNNTPVPGHYGLQHYKAYQLDQVFDMAKDRDIFIKLCLNTGWSCDAAEIDETTGDVIEYYNPYVETGMAYPNVAHLYLTSGQIWELRLNKQRYINARWGYSRNLESWELFNEVKQTECGDGDMSLFHQGILKDWCYEMTDYIKQIDIYDHLVTNSNIVPDSHLDYVPGEMMYDIMSDPDIDYTETHRYNYNVPETGFNWDMSPPPGPISSDRLQDIHFFANTEFKTLFEKPTMINEFLWHPMKVVNSQDANSEDFDEEGFLLRHCIWTSYCSGAVGTSSPWNWGEYMENEGNWWHLDGLSQFVALTRDKLNNGMSPKQFDTFKRGTIYRWTVLSGSEVTFGYMQSEKFDWENLWLNHNNYLYSVNPTYYPGFGNTSATINVVLANYGFELKWYNTSTMAVISTSNVVSDAQGEVTISSPSSAIHGNPAYGDLAFILEKTGALGREGTDAVVDQSLNMSEIYPQPAGDKFSVSLHRANDFQVTLVDLNGLEQFVYSVQDKSAHEFDISSLPAGMYIVYVEVDDKIEYHRLVKR